MGAALADRSSMRLHIWIIIQNVVNIASLTGLAIAALALRRTAIDLGAPKVSLRRIVMHAFGRSDATISGPNAPALMRRARGQILVLALLLILQIVANLWIRSMAERAIADFFHH
jgi:hypothetical protein